MTTEEMKANIQCGITWLNENRLGWQDKVRQKIKAGEFDMIMPCNCVIGATDGNFWNLYHIEDTDLPIEAIENGFVLPENEIDEQYAQLTQLWIEAINDL